MSVPCNKNDSTESAIYYFEVIPGRQCCVCRAGTTHHQPHRILAATKQPLLPSTSILPKLTAHWSYSMVKNIHQRNSLGAHALFGKTRSYLSHRGGDDI